MQRTVREYKKSLPVRLLALAIVKRNGSKDWYGEVKSIQDFVKRNIRYVKDIRGIETIATPIKTLELGQGDCDDQAILVASLLESIGYPTRFAAIGFMPGNFVHVFAEVLIKNKWVSVETTEPVSLGWIPKNISQILRIEN